MTFREDWRDFREKVAASSWRIGGIVIVDILDEPWGSLA
jgi:hypothetical protein